MDFLVSDGGLRPTIQEAVSFVKKIRPFAFYTFQKQHRPEDLVVRLEALGPPLENLKARCLQGHRHRHVDNISKQELQGELTSRRKCLRILTSMWRMKLGTSLTRSRGLFINSNRATILVGLSLGLDE